ncbi:VPS54 isoform 1 [Hibiscus syriacus]|uniref:VPS54 isoform 1 n=1 Tax=Hibiscus syriacus TaxID=106335 RepID=A0A6A2ZBE1_HIBSY|nr:VPS54 isoform 1 [Hibiscus syriacus]
MVGGSECNQNKPHYDITLSKRTRKPPSSHPQQPNTNDKESENEDRKSLKQLINGDETGGGTTSLGRHFSEEEQQLQLVKKNHQYNNNGVKLKGMMSRYAKVLSHLVKVKRDPGLGSKKKHLLRLTNIG